MVFRSEYLFQLFFQCPVAHHDSICFRCQIDTGLAALYTFPSPKNIELARYFGWCRLSTQQRTISGITMIFLVLSVYQNLAWLVSRQRYIQDATGKKIWSRQTSRQDWKYDGQPGKHSSCYKLESRDFTVHVYMRLNDILYPVLEWERDGSHFHYFGMIHDHSSKSVSVWHRENRSISAKFSDLTFVWFDFDAFVRIYEFSGFALDLIKWDTLQRNVLFRKIDFAWKTLWRKFDY